MKQSCLVVLVCMLIFSCPLANSSQTIPLNDETYDWVYQYLDYLFSRGLLSGLHYATKPYTREEVAKSIVLARDEMDNSNWVDEYMVRRLENEFSKDIGSEGTQISGEIGFLDNFQGKSKERSVSRKKLSLSAGIKPNPYFSAYTRYVVDEDLAKESTYTGKVWQGFAGDASQSYICFDLSNVSLFLGRDRLSWGESHFSSLILSQDGFPLDMFRLQGQWGMLKFASFAAVLSPQDVEDSAGTARINRYLSGHRLSFKPCCWLQIGFSETVIYGGENRNMELYYLVPFIWYHGVQLNEGKDDNTFFAVDFNLRPLKDLTFYGELLIDDIQVESKSKSDNEPDELGYMGGTSLANILLPGLEASLEYERISNWTYNQNKPYNRYLHKGKSLGSKLGTDADMLSFSLSGWIAGGLRLGLSYFLTRKGQGRMDAQWTQPWLDANGKYEEKFPTGIVEKKKTSRGFIEYDHHNLLKIGVFAGYTDVRNRDNVENSTDYSCEAGFSFFFRLRGSK